MAGANVLESPDLVVKAQPGGAHGVQCLGSAGVALGLPPRARLHLEVVLLAAAVEVVDRGPRARLVVVPHAVLLSHVRPRIAVRHGRGAWSLECGSGERESARLSR